MAKRPKPYQTPLDIMMVSAINAGPGNARRNIFCEIIKEHGGLGALIYKEFGHLIQPYEVKSYMYESLDDVVEHWKPELRKASTELRYRVMCRIRKMQQHQTYVGSVRIPYCRLAKTSKCGIDDVNEGKLRELYDELECDSNTLEVLHELEERQKEIGYI